MNRFPRFFQRKSIVSIAIAWSLIAAVPACQAQSAVRLDKHARKVEKRLARFRPGTFLDFEFRNGSKTFGALGPLSDASFQFTDSDSNKTETHLYADLARVSKAKEYIGQGSGPRHHVRLLVPVLIGVGAAAGGIAAYEVMR
ncbi:MAG: hypothetical protein ABSF23_07505 [Terracidiphilus sp.]|jgi:hypothetical protein